MLAIIGAVTISTVAAWLAFLVTFGTLANLGFWRRLEIGAILPLTVCGFIAALAVWVLTFWYFGPSIRVVVS